MQKINGETLNIINDNIQKLKSIFPEVCNEDRVDFEKLEAILGEYKENGSDRYNFTWPGKSKAIRIAQTPSTGTLRPGKEESENWNETQNLYIEGDNLEVLKLLQKSYYGKVKMIYIDPPYNTGNDFVYKDDFRDNIENYLEITGQKSNEGKKLTTNTESNGRYHSNWLNMIYPRLKLSKNLLSDDGFIAVSISDEELYNLKKVLDEIFGESNFRNNLLVRRYDKNINTQFADKGLKTLNVGSEYILIYSKTSNGLLNAVYREASDERKESGYWKGFWNDADRPTMRYEILNANISEGQWKWKKEVAEEAVENYKKYVNEFEHKMSLEEYWRLTGEKLKFIRRREGLNGKNKGVEHWIAPSKGILRSSNWNDILVSDSIGKYDLDFSSPKNPILIRELITMLSGKNDIILDFFSGSASTAEAVIRLNYEEGGERKFIMIQIPELVNEKTNAYKLGYRNICEIGKARIRKVGEAINDTNVIDKGFKVFKLDSSNINKWDLKDGEDIERKLYEMTENIKEGRTEEDILYEILLKYGIDLNMPIEEHSICGKKVFDIGFGAIIACLDNNVTLDVVKGIGKLKEELSPEENECRVVFLDSGFATDSVKTNAIQILKRYNIEDVKSI